MGLWIVSSGFWWDAEGPMHRFLQWQGDRLVLRDSAIVCGVDWVHPTGSACGGGKREAGTAERGSG